jgi:glycerol-3-phosphate acyltransferase PlsY
MGIILGLDWRFFIIIGISVILITLITDYLALGTFTTVITFPVWLFFMTPIKWAFLIPVIASLIIIVKHFENIKRMIKKEELGLRASFKKKKAS